MNLKIVRKKFQKTQEEVASMLNIKKQTYQNYELGKREPDIETLKKISQFFRVSIDELVDNDISPFISVANFSDEQKANLYLIEKLSPKNNLIANGYLLRLLQEQENS